MLLPGGIVNARVLSPVSIIQPLMSALLGLALYNSIHSSLVLVKLSAFQSIFLAVGNISFREMRIGKGVAVGNGVAVGTGVGVFVGDTLEDERDGELADALDDELACELAELDELAEVGSAAGMSGRSGPSSMVNPGRSGPEPPGPPPGCGQITTRPKVIHPWALAGVALAR